MIRYTTNQLKVFYTATLQTAGVTDILKMAITFDGKQVWIKMTE